jgi:hypothetical protein
MAGDELMKSKSVLSRGQVFFFVGILLFVGFNYWLMRQVEHTVGDEVMKKGPVPVAAGLPSGAHVPEIDHANDLLAPVMAPVSPQIYLKRRPQQSSEEKIYGLPQSEGVLTQ